MDRRTFLHRSVQGGAGAVAAAAAAGIWHTWSGKDSGVSELLEPGRPPAYSIIPVVGDGKWIWTEPPKGETGYLEPRSYRARVGVELQGTGNARRLTGATVAPVKFPEQKIDDVEITTTGCQAKLQVMKPGAAYLMFAAPQLRAGQTIRAVAEYDLTISKQYHGYERDQFPYRQSPPRDVKMNFLKDSPGIQTSCKELKELAEKLTLGVKHPWDQAKRFHEWVPENIKARIQPYTSVKAALKNHVGDCEERSAVFVALCRAVGIPARLVWVPNHNWSEMYLHDEKGKGHWLPVHTSCYPWFGWVGAHELYLQKGDRIRVKQRYTTYRLLKDWLKFVGSTPRVHWIAEITPQPPSEGEDPGPGARRKSPKGEWLIVGNHAMNKHMRR